MRAITWLLLGLTACATDKPAEVPRSNTGAERIEPRAEPAATQPDPRQYVGLRSPDLLLEAPAPLQPRGERILDDTSPYGLVALGVEGGNELIFLDRRTDEGDFIVEAVLELPAEVTSRQVAWDDCERDGKPDPRIVAVVAADAGCEPRSAPVSSAWRVDPELARFEAISPDGVRCPPPTCEGAGDNDLIGGVPGGVVGDSAN